MRGANFRLLLPVDHIRFNMSVLESWTATLFTLFVFVLALDHLNARFKAGKYPPGPRGDPFIGNYRTMRSTHAYLYYTKLKKIYGESQP